MERSILKKDEVEGIYHPLIFRGRRYLVSFDEILGVFGDGGSNSEEDHFVGVYEVTGQYGNWTEYAVRRVSDTPLLKKLTYYFENGEIDESLH